MSSVVTEGRDLTEHRDAGVIAAAVLLSLHAARPATSCPGARRCEKDTNRGRCCQKTTSLLTGALGAFSHGLVIELGKI